MKKLCLFLFCLFCFVGYVKAEDTTLSSLSISGGSLSPKFDKNVTFYTVVSNYNTKSIRITALPVDTYSNVLNTGTIRINSRNTIIDVTVNGKDGNSTVYKLLVKVKDVNGQLLPTDYGIHFNSFTFKESSMYYSVNTNSYNITVDNNITSLTPVYVLNDDRNTVEITGNENLSVGSNVVTVSIKTPDGYVNTYTINVTRKDSNSTSVAKDFYSIVKNRESPISITLDDFQVINSDALVLLKEFPKNLSVSINQNDKVVCTWDIRGAYITNDQIDFDLTMTYDEDMRNKAKSKFNTKTEAVTFAESEFFGSVIVRVYVGDYFSDNDNVSIYKDINGEVFSSNVVKNGVLSFVINSGGAYAFVLAKDNTAGLIYVYIGLGISLLYVVFGLVNKSRLDKKLKK